MDQTLKWAVLAVAAVLTAGAVLGLPRLEPEVDFVDTVPDHPGLTAYRTMLQELEGVRFVAIYMAHDEESTIPHLRTDDGFDAIVAEQGALTANLEAKFPGSFSHTLSVWEAMRAGHYMFQKIATGGNPPESAYSVPTNPAVYQQVRDQVRGGSVDDVLAADGSSSLMLVFLGTTNEQEARALSGALAEFLTTWDGPATTDHQASGLVYSSYVVDQQNVQDLQTWGWISAVVAGLAMLWTLRRVEAVGLAVLGTAVAIVWTFGTLGWLGIPISFLTLFLAPVVAGIGIDYSLHLLHRVEENETRDSAGAVRAALKTTSPAIIVSATTTAAGLAVLAWVPAPLFAEIGITAALGILLGLASTFLVVAPLRTAFAPGRFARPHSLALGNFAVAARRGGPFFVVALLALTAVVGAYAATHTRVESGAADNELPQDDPLIVLQKRVEEEYGAYERAYIIVQGDMAKASTLRALHDATADAASLPLFRSASSVTDFLLADEATDEGSVDILKGLLGSSNPPSEPSRLPQSDSEARQRLDALYDDPLWRTLVPFTLSADYQLAVVAITIEPWTTQADMVALRDALVAQAADLQERLPTYDVAAGGRPVNRAAIVEQTPDDVRLAIFGSAFVVAIGIGAFQARRGLAGLRVAAAGTVAVLVAAVWLLATIPALDALYTSNNAALNDMFLLAFAITVAVGIDDWVHLAGRFWEARDNGSTKDEALRHAFATSGRAITGTTLTTFAAFAVLGFVYFLQSKNLAILTAAGVGFAYVLAMLVAPWALAGSAPKPEEA